MAPCSPPTVWLLGPEPGASPFPTLWPLALCPPCAFVALSGQWRGKTVVSSLMLHGCVSDKELLGKDQLPKGAWGVTPWNPLWRCPPALGLLLPPCLGAKWLVSNGPGPPPASSLGSPAGLRPSPGEASLPLCLAPHVHLSQDANGECPQPGCLCPGLSSTPSAPAGPQPHVGGCTCGSGASPASAACFHCHLMLHYSHPFFLTFCFGHLGL